MENINKENINNISFKNQRSIYFIYSQTKNNIYQIKFIPKEETFNINELNLKYNQKNITKNKNIIIIFEISFHLQKSILKFYLEMFTIDKIKFISQEEYKIKKDKDLFIYNLEFKDNEDRNWLIFNNNDVKPPEKKQLSMMEQFNIFIQYLKEKNDRKIEKGSTKENLINDTIAILIKNKENFDFDLFLGLFREIYNYGYLKRLLTIFNIKKININKNIDPKLYENIFKLLFNKSTILSKYLNDEKLEKIFYDVSILFFKNFEQKYLENLLFPDLNNIKKDEEKNYLNKRAKIMINTILENPEKFSGLNNEIMKKLLNSMKEKKEKIKLIIFTKKLEIKLFVIIECLEEIKNKIEIESNSLEYNIEDNINKIFEYLFIILNYVQKINFQGIFVDIKEEVWNNYANEYYKNKKIKYLFLLRKIFLNLDTKMYFLIQ